MDNRALDALRLHSDADRIPAAVNGDLHSLRESLRDDGQQDPIDITPDGVILDGRTRWSLLRDLGAKSIQVRVVDIPAGQQTGYIVQRAVARRHLTAEQKRALNALLREVVVEVKPHPRTGEEMRIGHAQSERAATLGVGLMTVRRWDEARPIPNDVGPTHVMRRTGNVNPVHPAGPVKRRATPPRRGPVWLAAYTRFCRGVVAEDRPYLLRMSEEVHHALGLLGLECGAKGDN